VDLGTSGCRAIAIDGGGRPLAERRVALPLPVSPRDGWFEQDSEIWWRGVCEALGALTADLPDHRVDTLAVDGTSGTLLLADPCGEPLTPALMYNDRRAIDAAARVAVSAPPESPARGAGSSLSKLLYLADRATGPRPCHALHQADWVAARLTGQAGLSDWNNALKLGYDPEGLTWPGWVTDLIPGWVRLPRVLAPGETIAAVEPRWAACLGLSPTTRVVAGTTDSTAAAIAAGAAVPGDAVTCLGTTLVVKVVSDRPLRSAAHGVYSHRFGSHWLAGGASNSGGGVLRAYFDPGSLEALSRRIDPGRPSGLDYYPLPCRGERFPRNDPDLSPRLSPIPSDPVRLLHGLLEGIARIEAEAYALLESLGGPRPTRVLTTGGGAANDTWRRLRERLLGVPVERAPYEEAAYGAALCAARSTGGR
jgi:sugar (pentulose or hexulose) kinase